MNKTKRVNPERNNKFKKFLKKFWFIVWKDDSIKGWIISLIFLFIIIKGIFFPLMSLATGTKLPLVIVESCSMYHEKGIFSDTSLWWDRHSLKYFKYGVVEENWNDFSFRKGFNKGDILFVVGTKPENLKVGDVIIFNANYKNPIIHRIINITKENEDYIFSTIGDNNKEQIFFEKKINENQVLGKAEFIIAPYAGWLKLIFFEPTKTPQERGLCEENN